MRAICNFLHIVVAFLGAHCIETECPLYQYQKVKLRYSIRFVAGR